MRRCRPLVALVARIHAEAYTLSADSLHLPIIPITLLLTLTDYLSTLPKPALLVSSPFKTSRLLTVRGMADRAIQSDVLRSTGLQPEKGPPTVQSVRMVTSPLLPLPSIAQQPGENAHVG
jgi:hypothetical protein